MKNFLDFEERKKINEEISPWIKGRESQWWTKSILTNLKRGSEHRQDKKVSIKTVPFSKDGNQKSLSAFKKKDQPALDQSKLNMQLMKGKI